MPTEIDPVRQRIFDEAQEVELLATQLFSGIAQAYDGNFGQAFFKTERLIRQGAKAVYQPSFRTRNGLFCRSDIIARNGHDRWDLYEIKSSTRPKDEHFLDLAFQRIVLEDVGLGVGKTFVIHVNTDYVRNGPIDPAGILTVSDVTDDVEAVMPRVYADIGPAMDVMGKDSEPAVPILNQCHRPFECPFVGYCWRDVPKDSVHRLGLDDGPLSGFLDQGTVLAKDVPEEAVTARGKRLYLQSLKLGRPIIDRESVIGWLRQLRYPICHLDYETFASAIPLFDGYRPYQQMPFQYSVHVQDSPGADIRHFEYLAETWGDPVPKLAESLSGVIGSGGTVMSWYSVFESGRNDEMGAHLPEFAEFFSSVNSRMVDLMEPFKEGMYADCRFGGSASLKAVLPVLVPSLSYKGLGIGNGGLASVQWRKMVDRHTSAEESRKIRADLLEYCGQDTLAMVRILEVLEGLRKKTDP